MPTLLLLAQEAPFTHRTVWNPTLLGILTVVAGIVLFCGSIYLLLATNLGARLGFLVAFTGLMGWMVILTTLWITTASPLNTLRGRPPSWKAKEAVEDLSEAKTPQARNIATDENKASVQAAADLKSSVDATLLSTATPNAEGETPEPSRFAKFEEVTDYSVVDTWKVGGSHPNPLDFELTHEPTVAVAEYCPVLDVEPEPGLPPPEPTCDPDEPHEFLVLEQDLGSVRVPPVVAWLMSIVLFGLGLLLLHWRERDEAVAAAQAGRPVPVPST